MPLFQPLLSKQNSAAGWESSAHGCLIILGWVYAIENRASNEKLRETWSLKRGQPLSRTLFLPDTKQLQPKQKAQWEIKCWANFIRCCIAYKSSWQNFFSLLQKLAVEKQKIWGNGDSRWCSHLFKHWLVIITFWKESDQSTYPTGK